MIITPINIYDSLKEDDIKHKFFMLKMSKKENLVKYSVVLVPEPNQDKIYIKLSQMDPTIFKVEVENDSQKKRCLYKIC